jgi:DNA polymerase-3 subunit alpha
MTTGPGFIHLRVHSAYSLLEGALPIKKLAELATADAQPALAITDRNNLFGALEFSETLTGAGVQPIVGCTLSVQFGETGTARPDAAPRPDGAIALIAKDETGYKSLMKLSSAAYLDHCEDTEPFVTLADLEAHHEGLIALTGGPEGPVDAALREGDEVRAKRVLERLAAIYPGRLYVELQRHGLASERAVEPSLVELAYANDLPLVATNQCYFPAEEDFEAHDALICVAEGRYVVEEDRRRLTQQHRFKTRDEMMSLFSDLPEALENTVEIARRCAFRVRTHPPILPDFASDGADTPEARKAAEDDALREQAWAGLEARLAKQGYAPGHECTDYEARLKHELDVITSMNFSGYFLIVADFIQWAKQQSIPVGPGRGSGAGSAVAWALTITDLDPLRHGLLFERFLNPERVSMPDFDIDFCQDRRDEVIGYVQRKYGHDRVAQIITFGKLQARAVLRDVGRVLQMPYGQVDRLCKLVPNNPANPVTLQQAIDDEPKLQEARNSEEIVAQLLDIAQRLEGLYRHASTHAAGVVIGDRALEELVPLYRDPRSPLPVTQFNMKWVEPAGLVKFDFLGLKTLTVIENARRLAEGAGEALDLDKLSLDDAATYELIARGDTVGVFQLESTGMREALRKLKPDRFEDIIAMVSLYRPGPMDNIDPFINRKYGREEPDYLHPRIEPILKETYGVIIYQEQVMQIAQELSGYSLGEADLLRRAMGKKIKAEMDKQRERFISGAVERGVEKARAAHIFELVAKFAGYGFNKSHAAAYALLAYQTAYLKANHPVAFLAASMTLDMGNTDKVGVFVQEARRMGVGLEPPSVNESGVEFLPQDGAIRYSLAALRNVGRSVVEHIVAERDSGGAFQSLADFAARINPRIVNKRGLESLAAAGAFDCLEPDRAKVCANVDVILGAAGRLAGDRAAGQSDLFGAGEAEPPALALRAAPAWGLMERLSQELDAVGFFLSGHPLDDYRDMLAALNIPDWASFEAKARAQNGAGGKVAATVLYKQERKSKSGNRFAFAGFSDPTGQFEAVVFSDTLSAVGEALEPGSNVVLTVECDVEGDNLKTRVASVQTLDDLMGRKQAGAAICVDGDVALDELVKRLSPGGSGRLSLAVRLDELGREVRFELGEGYDLSPRSLSALKTLPGVREVRPI